MKRFILLLVLVLSACAPGLSEFAVTSTSPPPNVVLPSPSPVPAALTARVTADTVNVRSEPNGKVIAMLHMGESVTILGCEKSWCKIGEQMFVWQGCISYNPQHLGCSEAR